MKKHADQLDFDFTAGGHDSGHEASWTGLWKKARLAAARRLGLPIGHRIRVEFAEGPPIEGFLEFDEDQLFSPQRRDVSVALRVGSARFLASEIAACVRLDPVGSGPVP